MNVFLGIVIIMISCLNVFIPESMLRFQDIFRLKGDRQYSDFIIVMTRFGGIVGVALGFVTMFMPMN